MLDRNAPDRRVSAQGSEFRTEHPILWMLPRVAAGLFAVLLSQVASAQSPARVNWLTGRALDSRLSTVVPRAFWSAMPLRKVLHTIATTQRVAVLADRRVDRDRTVDLTLNDATVAELLERIAKDHGLGLARLGDVTYLGPPAVAAQLRTLAILRQEDVAKLSASAARRLKHSAPLVWDDFATPRELLSRLVEPAGIALEGLEQVPHDLWGAADLPALPLVDRLTLVAVQFDLTFRIAADGRSLRLVPVPEDLPVTRGTSAADDSHQPSERPGVAQRPPKRTPSKRPPTSPKAIRYTVQNSKGPMDRLIAELGKKLQVDVRIERDALGRAGISPSQTVSFSVTDATVDELFEAVLSPAGCTFRREGDVIVVVPAERGARD